LSGIAQKYGHTALFFVHGANRLSAGTGQSDVMVYLSDIHEFIYYQGNKATRIPRQCLFRRAHVLQQPEKNL